MNLENNTEKLTTKNSFYCPICNRNHKISDYLKSVFNNNEKALWFANMVTHYRHTHISSWNKCWGYNGHYYRKKWFGNYEEEKSKVNERAKRQIIRKAGGFMLKIGFEKSDLLMLNRNDKETIELFDKKMKINDIAKI